jgi:glutathione-regulated potassium-efflux system ancillary protein KefG
VKHRILILFAHPALERSRVNRRLIDGVRDVDGVHVQDLYEEYPDLDIDVQREQALLRVHDVIVFHHPLYWYSAPAILKEWQDLVLEHGWAFGPGGDALAGKRFLSVVTTGAGAETYKRDGANRYTIEEFLAPLEQSARLCAMDVLPPFVVHGTHKLRDGDISGLADLYRRTMRALRDGSIDLDVARAAGRLGLTPPTGGGEDSHAR